jgi:hypothetical protein
MRFSGLLSSSCSLKYFNIIFISNVINQLGSTCAIVGGITAQEIIKAISLKDRPLNNSFYFDPENCAGKMECIGC